HTRLQGDWSSDVCSSDLGAAETLERRGRYLHVTFDDAYVSVERILPVLERLGVPVTVFACAGLANDGRGPDIEELAWETEHFPDEVRTMDWNALRDLVARGVEVESHTLSHPHLPRLSDAELDRELRESKEQLEDELRRACRFLAYP